MGAATARKLGIILNMVKEEFSIQIRNGVEKAGGYYPKAIQ